MTESTTDRTIHHWCIIVDVVYRVFVVVAVVVVVCDGDEDVRSITVICLTSILTCCSLLCRLKLPVNSHYKKKNHVILITYNRSHKQRYDEIVTTRLCVMMMDLSMLFLATIDVLLFDEELVLPAATLISKRCCYDLSRHR
jgi:hypothetical protein